MKHTHLKRARLPIPPLGLEVKLPILEIPKMWSGKRDSDPRPRPWQGRALPTELFPLVLNELSRNGIAKVGIFFESANFL